MRRTVQVLIAVMLFVLGWAFPVLANTQWEPPGNYKAPPVYGNREYTRQHWTDFYLNEGAGARLLFSGHCSVFDLLPNYSEGYTAVGNKDTVDWKGIMYLDALGVPQSGGYWIVSPAYWSRHMQPGTVAPLIPNQSSEMLPVPVSTVRSSSGLTLGFDTIANPKCFKNGPTGGFEAGGYGSDGKPYHWYSLQSDSPVALTQKYASNLYGKPSTTKAKIVFDYIYGLTASGLQPTGSPSNGRQTWAFTVFNTTPYIAKDVVFRAYIVQNGKYTLAAKTTTDIGPRLQGDGFGGIMRPTSTWKLGQGVTQNGTIFNTVTWTFDAPVPSGDYKIVATAGLSLSDSGTPLAEPLKTEVAYGHNMKIITGLTGTRQEVAPFIFIADNSLGAPEAYRDNYRTSSQQQGFQPPGPPGSQPGSNDLAVTGIEVVDAQTGQPVSSPQSGQPVKVKSTFASGFNVSGWAKIRLYKYQVESKRLDELDSTNIYFKPNGSFSKEWEKSYGLGTGQYKFIVSINYYNNSDNLSSGWQSEKFDGKYNEKTYDNNKMEKDLTGTEAPPRIPQPRQVSWPVWYPPLAWKEVPVYETITEPIYGWKKVKFVKEKADGKMRVRLVQ